MFQRSRRNHQVVSIVLVFAATAASAVGEQRVWWAQSGSPNHERRAMNLTGTDKATMGTIPSSSNNRYTAMAVEGLSDRLLFYVVYDYTADSSTIWKIDLNTLVFTNLGVETGYVLAITTDDGAAERIYYSLESQIIRRNFDGSARTLIVDVGQRIFSGCLALDRVGNRLYYQTDAGISRVAQTGGATQLVVPGPFHYGVAVDGSAGKLYWTEFDTIRKANLDGSSPQTIYTRPPLEQNDPTFIALDGLGKMYWNERGILAFVNVIKRANIDGTGVQTLNTAPVLDCWALALEVGSTSCRVNNPFGDVNDNGGVNFQDVSATVACFQGQPSCSHDQFNRADLNPCNSAADTCQGDGIVNFQDTSKCVGAFQGRGCP